MTKKRVPKGKGVLFAYITKKNLAYIKGVSMIADVSMSQYLDALLTDASKRKPIKVEKCG